MQSKGLILISFVVFTLLLLSCGGRPTEKPMLSGAIGQDTFVHPDPVVLEQQQKDADQGKETWRITSPERVARLLDPDLFRILRTDEVRLKELIEGMKTATLEVIRKDNVVAEINLARYRNEESGIWFVTKVRVFVSAK